MEHWEAVGKLWSNHHAWSAPSLSGVVCRHGMGHWEALAADSRLGLESKLEAAAVEKRGKAYQPPEELKELPKGAPLSTIDPPKALH